MALDIAAIARLRQVWQTRASKASFLSTISTTVAGLPQTQQMQSGDPKLSPVQRLISTFIVFLSSPRCFLSIWIAFL
jgi:hypothetical protein